MFFGPVRDLDADRDADVWSSPSTTGYAFGPMKVAPDLDGDGRANLVLSAPSGAYGSVVSVDVPSSGSFDSGDYAWSLSSDESSAYLGLDQLAFGDFDDVADVLVGAYLDGASSEGAAYVFYGPRAGSESVRDASVTFTGGSSLAYAWRSVAAADLDGDGADDPIVSAAGADGEAADAGLIHLLQGGGF